jgi:endoglucanase
MSYLQALSDAAGISGQEDAIRALILPAIEPHTQEIKLDALGNILALQRGTDGANRPRVMLAAHMDEVGFMVTGYDSSGLLQFKAVGGIDASILPGLRVRVGKQALYGAVMWVPIHKGHSQDVVAIDALRIDIGAANKGEAEGKAPLGTMIVFDSTYGMLGELWHGKALDDRAGCSLLIDLLQSGPYPVDVLAAFTVQEEVGLRGATVAARALQPDVAFVLETTTAHDLPDPVANPAERFMSVNPTARVGDGPVLTVMDSRLIVNPVLLKWIRQTADQHGIPYQIKSRTGGGTDGGMIHMQNAGIPTAVISLPARYLHSPSALLHPQDYGHQLKLLQAMLHSITAQAYEHR